MATFDTRRISEVLAAEFDHQIRNKEAQIQALESKERALTATIAELQEQVDGLMEKMEWKKEYDQLRAQVREFANS